jgi:hypothetical protein
MISFKGIWSTAKMVSKAYPAASAASKYIDAASVVSVYGKSSTYKDNAIVAESLLVLE